MGSGRFAPIALQSLFYTLVLAVVAFIVLYPAFRLLVGSFEINAFSANPSMGFDNWKDVFSRPRLLAAIENTITLSVARQSIAILIGVTIAWLIARTNLPYSNWLEVGFWIALFMPALPVTLAWVLLAGESIGILNNAAKILFSIDHDIFQIYSWWGIVWVHVMTSTLAIKVFLLVPAFRNMDAAFEDAARTCGASVWKTLLHIVVPIMLPTIIVVTVLGLIRSLQAFEVELILGSPAKIDVYSTAIYRAVNGQPPLHGIASVLSITFLAAVVPLVALQQWYAQRNAVASVSSKFSHRVQDLGRLRWPLFAAIAVLLSMMTVLPFALLIMGSFMKLFGIFDLPEPWTTAHWVEAFGRGDLQRAFWNSMKLGLLASLAGMVSFSLIAYIAVKTRFRGRKVLDFLTWLPAVIPGLVLSLGILQMFASLPFFRPIYGTLAVLVLAVVIGTMALGTQIIKAALQNLGQELEEASWASGASRFYTFRRVVLPLIAPAVAVIGLEVFATGISVVGLVALLGTGNTQPLSILQLIYLDGGFFEPGAIVGLLITTITVSAALLARYIGLKSGLGRAGS
ncbi:MAG: ABC transporter permease [Burkholderiales bacterium]